MKSRVVQLCIDVSIKSMVAILRLGCNQIMRVIVMIMIKYIVKVDKISEIKEWT